jgi:glycosyltransferase involved in cell wall biosynthesis
VRGRAAIYECMTLIVEKVGPRARVKEWMERVGRPGLASIIIPTFNRAELLEHALESAAGQTYRPVEIIVVDDGSVDDTPAVVDRWRGRLEREAGIWLRYVYQSNGGVGSARNRGLRESRGEFIQYLDSDDILNPEKLRLHIECLREHAESGLAFSDMARLDDAGKWTAISVEQGRQIESAAFYCDPRMLTMVGVYRRETCYAAGPWSEDISLGEDEEYSFRALMSTEKCVYLPGNLCAFRDHTGPRLTDVQKQHRGLMLELKAYQRMAELARKLGRLGDPRVLTPLTQRMTCMVVGALNSGDAAAAEAGIRSCRALPIGMGRRVRLGIYEILNLLPTGVFGWIWPAWLRVRRLCGDVVKTMMGAEG